MATMYVYNIPTNETVNLRKTPSSSGTILVRVGYGKAVQASYYDSTWHSASYNGYSGYIMSKFLSATDPNGGGSSGDGGTPTAGVIQGTSVRVRAQPNTNSTILTQVNTGDKVTYYAGKTYSGSGYTWYRCTGSKWSGDGYIATNYVVKDTGGGGTGGGSYLGQGTVIGGGPLFCRKQPEAGFQSWGQFQEGAVIPIYSCSTSGWYETRWPASGSNVGYVMSQFISMNSGGGGSSYTVGKFGATNTGAVFVRKSAGGTPYSQSEKLRLGSTFLIAGTTVSGSTTWVKVRYGTAAGGSTDAYISATYFDELASPPAPLSIVVYKSRNPSMAFMKQSLGSAGIAASNSFTGCVAPAAKPSTICLMVRINVAMPATFSKLKGMEPGIRLTALIFMFRNPAILCTTRAALPALRVMWVWLRGMVPTLLRPPAIPRLNAICPTG